MDNDLKIFALEYVKLHDRLLKEQKLVIGQFIMEASDDQVSYMLLTGEVKDKLTKENRELVITEAGDSGAMKSLTNFLTKTSSEYLDKASNMGKRAADSLDKINQQSFNKGVSRGLKHGLEKGQAAGYRQGALTGLGVAVAVAAIATISYGVYKRFLSKGARACAGRSGTEKTNCMNKFKNQAMAAKIKFLQTGMAKCDGTKNPSVCRLKLQKRINKEKAKTGAL